MSHPSTIFSPRPASASLITLFLLISCVGASDDVMTEGQDAFSGLDELATVKMEEGKLPGLAACVIANGEVVWTGTYGWANIEGERLVDTDTPFMLASVSKLVTVTALMQLEEDARISLDEPINPRLPFDVDNPHVEGEEILVGQLLTHSSGIRDNYDVWGELGQAGALYTYNDSSVALRTFLEGFLTEGGAWYDPAENYNTWAPAENWEYSNVGVALAAYLVEVVTGGAFDDYSDAEIFAPLGMRNTGWHLSDHDSDRVAMPYWWNEDRYEAYGHYGYPDYPDGQLRASLSDMSRFARMMLNGGELDGVRLLDESTVDLILTPTIPDLRSNQALMWYTSTWGEHEMIGHGGYDYGVATLLLIEPDEKFGVILLSNTDRYEIAEVAFNEYAQALVDVAAAL